MWPVVKVGLGVLSFLWTIVAPRRSRSQLDYVIEILTRRAPRDPERERAEAMREEMRRRTAEANRRAEESPPSGARELGAPTETPPKDGS